MSKAPPIPPEQRSFRGQRPDVARDHEHAEDGNAGQNLREQGRHGNLRQNVSDVQHKVQDR